MRGLSLCGLVLCSGCFSYARLDTAPSGPAPKQGTDVIARLGAPAEFPLGAITIHDVTEVSGRLSYADADSMVIAARRLSSASGGDYDGSDGLITIRRSQVAGLEQRKLSAWKTGIAIGAGGGVIVATVAGVRQLLGAGAGGGGKPPPLP